MSEPGPAPARAWTPPDLTRRSDDTATEGASARWSAAAATPTAPVTGQVPGQATGPAGPPERRTVTAGSLPLRPLTLGDILDGTFATVRRNPRATIGISALLVTAGELLALAVQVLAGEVPGGTFTVGDDDSLTFTGGVGTVSGLLIQAVFGALLTGMIVVVVSEDVMGRRSTAADVWRRTRPRLWALLAAALLAGALPYLGLLLLVLPGVFLWGVLALTTPALVLERIGPWQALKRSWQLAMPAFFRVWGIRALSVLLGFVIQLAVVIPFTVLTALLMDAFGDATAAQLPLYALAVVTVGAIVAGTLVQPFYAGVLALLYVDCRMRSEGLDITMQLRERATHRTAGPRPTAAAAATVAGEPR